MTAISKLLAEAKALLAHAGHIEELGCTNAAAHMRDAADLLETVAEHLACDALSREAWSHNAPGLA